MCPLCGGYAKPVVTIEVVDSGRPKRTIGFLSQPIAYEEPKTIASVKRRTRKKRR